MTNVACSPSMRRSLNWKRCNTGSSQLGIWKRFARPISAPEGDTAQVEVRLQPLERDPFE
jgi:hypothetical protein